MATACLIAAATAAPTPANAQDAVGPAAPSRTGAAGLYGMSTTDVGAVRSLRVALYGDLSRASDFLVLGDVNTQARAELAAGFTWRRHVELFGAVRAGWNRNEQAATPSTGAATSTIGSGGFAVGAKLVTAPRHGLTGGGELAAGLPFAAGSWPGSGVAWVTALGALDLAALTRLPLRAHLSVGYIADGSRTQIDFTGQPASARQIAMFARGMDASRLRFAFGLDAPLEDRTGRLGLHPFAEYHAEIAISGEDPALSDQSPYNPDRHWLTFGLRARATARVTAMVGGNVTLRQVGIPFGPPLPPWSVFAGAVVPLHF
jgi:hypothetical protein